MSRFFVVMLAMLIVGITAAESHLALWSGLLTGVLAALLGIWWDIDRKGTK